MGDMVFPGGLRPDGLPAALLTANPNGVNPRRYDPSAVNDVLTCDQDHDYGDGAAGKGNAPNRAPFILDPTTGPPTGEQQDG